MKKISTALWLAALTSVTVHAASLDLALYETVRVNGAATLQKVTTALPGQVLRQVAVVTTDKAVSSPRATIPVPAYTTFAGNLALPSGATATFSLDGKTFSPKPMKSVTVNENGRSVTKLVPAPEQEYRAVRVTLPAMKLNTPYTVAYDIKVN
ncbi:hypothetical protein [Deinococcus multiflagellatus]|uniref:DUF4165 domain-containing protein n=1 Tax=Deinococcus multiflagellatus TaxID=1656887 RepID=A0ABW1ZNW1_9DEIO|nr:hypothetical protein [Deinococcus multiflagellatus]MBZ9714939.1 hypothetical protein [Deinococcus multiflagellatus]